MSKFEGESMGETTMVTNVELVKEVIKQTEKDRLLEEALEDSKGKLDEVVETTNKMKEKMDTGEEKGKEVVEEDN